MGQLLELVKDKKNLGTLLILGILILALPIGINLLRQQQLLKSRAAADPIVFKGPNVDQRNGNWVALKPQISFEITSPMGPPGSPTPAPNTGGGNQPSGPTPTPTLVPFTPTPTPGASQPTPTPVPRYSANLIDPRKLNDEALFNYPNLVNGKSSPVWFTGGFSYGCFSLITIGPWDQARADIYYTVNNDGQTANPATGTQKIYGNYAIFCNDWGNNKTIFAVIWDSSVSYIKLQQLRGEPHQIVQWFTGADAIGTFKFTTDQQPTGGQIQIDEYVDDAQSAFVVTHMPNDPPFTIPIGHKFALVMRKLGAGVAVSFPTLASLNKQI